MRERERDSKYNKKKFLMTTPLSINKYGEPLNDYYQRTSSLVVSGDVLIS